MTMLMKCNSFSEFKIEEMSAKAVKEYVENLDELERESFSEILLEDSRKTVQKIGEKIQKEVTFRRKEQERVKALWQYENNAFEENYQVIAGVDEAGRGPLAGPVVAAAVVLPKNLHLDYIDDSKKINEKKRDLLFDQINELALAIGIGIVDESEIDDINILNASKKAMKKAIASLNDQLMKKNNVKIDYLLIDAVVLDDILIKQENLIKGDSKSISIAAASIIAKVTRDNMLYEYDKRYPGYGFKDHKGYGTKAHYKAIEELGITSIHRKSFLKNIL